jgi:hypothetical protein
MNEHAKKFIDKHRWDLAQHHLARSDHSANLVRGFLFSVAAADVSNP